MNSMSRPASRRWKMNRCCCWKARSNIRDLETEYGLILPRDAGFETLAGFILARLQRIPDIRDTFEYEGRRYTVEEMEGHRIAECRIEKTAKTEAEMETARQRGD